jgi:hypothetical protein
MVASRGVLVAGIFVAFLTPASTAGQGTEENLAPLRTPWGDPDLQGVWNNATTTPLQRPPELAGKDTLTDEEVAQRDVQFAEARSLDRRDDEAPGLGTEPGGRLTVADVSRAYNEFWVERGKTIANNRTSIIVDPGDGRLPPLTSDGQRRTEARVEFRRGRGPSDSWEDRRLAERCIIYRGIPAMPTLYNNNYQIAQTPEYVAIFQEHIHEVRVIPIDGRSHLDDGVRQWLGDSRGHWEGETLVVETTNFHDQALIRGFNGGLGESLRVVERFTRVNADSIDYQFTVIDPTTWTRPWSGSLPMTRSEGLVYEYACHEGNRGMFNLLAGARVEELGVQPGSR